MTISNQPPHTTHPFTIARLVFVMMLAAVFAFAGAAECYPPGTRVVVFVQGVYTDLEEDGTQTSYAEAHRFDALKAAFRDRGYDDDALLDYSYAGGDVTEDGAWAPAPYECELTDRPAIESVLVLESMLREYREEHPRAHFALAGHSLGGYVAFLAAARDAARPEDERLGVDVVVTLDAPLLGASADKKVIIDLVDCAKTYEAGGELVAAKADPATPDVRRYQAWAMAQAGVRLATYGNAADCFWNTVRCVPGDWTDDSASQVLPGQAAWSQMYDIPSEPLSSHDAILVDPGAIADVVTFVGAR